MSVREKEDPDLYARIQERNLLRQYDLLTNCIEIGLKNGIECFDKYAASIGRQQRYHSRYVDLLWQPGRSDS